MNLFGLCLIALAVSVGALVAFVPAEHGDMLEADAKVSDVVSARRASDDASAVPVVFLVICVAVIWLLIAAAALKPVLGGEPSAR